MRLSTHQTREEAPLREIVEDTVDWLTSRCGASTLERAPRSLRAAVRHLGSERAALRSHAETCLLHAPRNHVLPLLRQAARSQDNAAGAIRAALLLHRLHDKQGAELLHHLAQNAGLRSGEHGEPLRRAARHLLDPHHYVQQAASALTRLEQRPDSFAAIVRFRQAAEMLRFLHAPLPASLLSRALVVRTVGGENLSLARHALRGTQDPSLEHVCLVRREAVLLLLHQSGREHACAQLMQALAHPSPAVQLTLLYGLAELNDARAVSAVLPIACDESSPIREEAQALVTRLKGGSPDALTLLRASAHLSHPREEMLRSAQMQDDDPATLLRPPLSR